VRGDFVIFSDFISLNNLFVCFNRYPFILIFGFMFSPSNLFNQVLIFHVPNFCI